MRLGAAVTIMVLSPKVEIDIITLRSSNFLDSNFKGLCCKAVVKNASLTAVADIKTEEQQIYNTTYSARHIDLTFS